MNLFPSLLAPTFLEYLQENLIFVVLIAVCVLAIVAIAIVLAVCSRQGKKRREAEQAQAAEETAEESSDAPAVEEPASEVTAEETAEEPMEEPIEEAAEQPAPAVVAVEESAPAAEEASEEPAEEPVKELVPEPAEEPAEEPAPVAEEKTEEKADKAEKAEKPARSGAKKGASGTKSKTSAAKEKGVEGESAPKKSGKTRATNGGKWTVIRVVQTDDKGEERESAYFFALHANNGVMLITSEEYTTQRGATQGIETFKTNIANGNFRISVSKKGKYIVKLLNAQSSILTQGEKYPSRAAAESAIASIKRFAASAVLSEEVVTMNVPYEEATVEEKAYNPEVKGKWIVKKVESEDGKDVSYYFELRANNGQLLFTSEEYTSLAGVKAGMKTHVANIAAGNIRAVITRNGDYILKIFKGNGQLLCLGEHYNEKQLCLNAIESVKRFAAATELPETITLEEETQEKEEA